MAGFTFFGLLSTADAIITEAGLHDPGQVHPELAPMLDNVGQLGTTRSGSVVYLREQWVLTAHHAFAGRGDDLVYFAGKSYKLLPNTAVRMKNRSARGAKKNTDLVMVRLEAAPDLPDLKIDEHSPFIEEKVVMIGCGESQPPKPIDDLLTDQDKSGSTIAIEAISGGLASGIASPRWGENEISDLGIDVALLNTPGSTQAFATVKQQNHSIRKTQGASGDSGGGVFVKRGEQWKLSGIMLSVLRRDDMGASATFSADLSKYRDQINATIPEPSVAVLLFMTSLMAIGRRSR